MRKHIAALFIAVVSVVCFAPGIAGAASNEGYWTTNDGAIVKNSDSLCWRTGHWTPEMATLECDPELLPAPEGVPVGFRSWPNPFSGKCIVPDTQSELVVTTHTRVDREAKMGEYVFYMRSSTWEVYEHGIGSPAVGYIHAKIYFNSGGEQIVFDAKNDPLGFMLVQNSIESYLVGTCPEVAEKFARFFFAFAQQIGE